MYPHNTVIYIKYVQNKPRKRAEPKNQVELTMILISTFYLFWNAKSLSKVLGHLEIEKNTKLSDISYLYSLSENTTYRCQKNLKQVYSGNIVYPLQR